MRIVNSTEDSQVNPLSILAAEFFDEIEAARREGLCWYDIVDAIRETLKNAGRPYDFSALKLERYYHEVKRVKKTLEIV